MEIICDGIAGFTRNFLRVPVYLLEHFVFFSFFFFGATPIWTQSLFLALLSEYSGTIQGYSRITQPCGELGIELKWSYIKERAHPQFFLFGL